MNTPARRKRIAPTYLGASKKKYTKKQTVAASQNRSTTKNVSIASYAPSLRSNWFKTHIGGFPQRMKETIRYAYSNSSSVAFSTYAEPIVMVMNGTYDPDAALGGGQPAAFTKLMAVYTKCYVKAAKITVKYTPLPQTNNVVDSIPWLVGITITTNGTSLGGYQNAIQGGLVTWHQVMQSPDTITLTQSVDIGKFLSVDDIMDGSSFYNTNAANPTQIVVAHGWVYNLSGGTSGYMQYSLTVDFECIFADPTLIT